MPLLSNPELITPTQNESLLARKSSHQLARLLDGIEHSKPQDLPVKIEIHLDGDHEIVSLPASALQLLNHILTQMAQGNAITIIPTTCEITTQQAAEVLNVSRPFLIGLLEKKEIPFRKVGAHRRILLEDVMHYKQEIDDRRLAALRELSELSEELGLDD